MGLLDLVFPRSCLGCGEPAEELCARCRAGLVRIRPPLCERCGNPTAWPLARCVQCAGRRVGFAVARSAVAYDETVRRLAAGWKERGLRRVAELAAEIVCESIDRPEGTVVTFVPPDRDRTLERGHHPAERLARALAERWELPVEALLSRPRSGPRQRGLALAERRRNVAGAFRPREACPRKVILVDDVYTTGSTANAAASALRRGGTRSVSVITFARVVR